MFLYHGDMPTKKKSKDQITLPKVGLECIALPRLEKSRADEVRFLIAPLGIDERDVAAAICWVRRGK